MVFVVKVVGKWCSRLALMLSVPPALTQSFLAPFSNLRRASCHARGATMRCCGALEFDPVSSTERSLVMSGSTQFRLRGRRIPLGGGSWFSRFRILARKSVAQVDKFDVGLISVASVARSITIMMPSAPHLASLRGRVHGRFSISFSSVGSQCCELLVSTSVLRWVPFVAPQLAAFELSTWRC